MKMSDLHALLIGINYYLPNLLPNGLYFNNLLGCVRDIVRTEAFLRSRLGVPPENIIKLTSSNNGKNEPAEIPSQWPTYENIVRAFHKITETARSGDQVFIHYSGHGGRTRTSKPFRKLKGKDGIDEVLVPMDIGNSEGRYLRDTEIHYLLKAMVDRGLIVTIALDTCHAGGTVRTPGVRGIGVVDMTERRSDSLVASPEQLVQAWEAQSQLTGTRDADAGSGWLLEPQGFVLIAACRANEQANEHAFEKGETSGALSYWLVDSLKQLGPGLTYKMLHDRVLAKVHSQFAAQTPQLEGEGNRVVFGSEESLPQYAVTVMKVSSNDAITLNAGQAHGVTPHSRFNVFQLHETDLTKVDRRIAVVEVSKTGAVESEARILDRFGAGIPEPGCQAVLLEVGNLCLRRQVFLAFAGRVASESEPTHAKEIVDTVALQPNRFVKITANPEECDYRVAIDHNDRYVICDPAGNEFPNLRPPLHANNENAPVALVQRLEHLARYANVRRLDNNDPLSVVSRKLIVDVLGWQKNYVVEEKPRPKSFKGPYVVKHGEWVFLRVRNEYSEVLNITVLDLQPDWGIAQMYPKRAGEFESIDPDRELVLPIQFTLPSDYESGTDMIKVFATVEPTSFRWLELPSLDQPELINNLRGVSSKEIEEFLLTINQIDSGTRQGSVPISSSALWAARQVEIEVRR
jgi:hypothetical protein